MEAGMLVVDVRNPDEFARSRIVSATNIPLPELSKGRSDGLPGDRETPVVTICSRGKRSVYGLLLLKARGYRNVKSVEGGMGAWIDAGFPIV